MVVNGGSSKCFFPYNSYLWERLPLAPFMGAAGAQAPIDHQHTGSWSVVAHIPGANPFKKKQTFIYFCSFVWHFWHCLSASTNYMTYYSNRLPIFVLYHQSIINTINFCILYHRNISPKMAKYYWTKLISSLQ